MKSYRWLFWLLAATGLILDQTSKYGIFGYLYNDGLGGEITIVENYFTIETQYDHTAWEDDGGLVSWLRTDQRHAEAARQRRGPVRHR